MCLTLSNVGYRNVLQKYAFGMYSVVKNILKPQDDSVDLDFTLMSLRGYLFYSTGTLTHKPQHKHWTRHLQHYVGLSHKYTLQ